MARIIPGVYTSVRTSGVAPTTGVNNGVVGFVGDFVFGPVNEAIVINSLSDIDTKLGGLAKADAKNLYAMILQRPRKIKAVRIVGTGAAKSTKTLKDSESSDSLTITALYEGAYGDDISVQVANGILTITYGDIIETYNVGTSLTTLVSNINASSELVAAAAASGATDVPATIAETNLTGGSDGTVNDAAYVGGYNAATDARTGLSVLDVDTEVEIVTIGGTPSSTKNTALLAHADSNMRIAVVPFVATDMSTILSEKSGYESTDGQRFVAYPNVVFSINGVNTTINAAFPIAGVLGRIEPHRSTANQFIYGAVSLSRGLTTSETEQLILSRINPITLKGTGYAIRHGLTLATSTDWQQIGNRRVFNIIAKDVDDLLDSFTGEPIDSELFARVIAKLNGYMSALLSARWISGYRNICDASLNTAETIALGNLKAQSYVAPVNIAHYILVDINKVVTVTPPSAVE